jgi:hypothetical protein
MKKGGASKDKKPAEKKGSDKGKGKPDEAGDKGGKVRKHLLSLFASLVPIARGFSG